MLVNRPEPALALYNLDVVALYLKGAFLESRVVFLLCNDLPPEGIVFWSNHLQFAAVPIGQLCCKPTGCLRGLIEPAAAYQTAAPLLPSPLLLIHAPRLCLDLTGFIPVTFDWQVSQGKGVLITVCAVKQTVQTCLLVS